MINVNYLKRKNIELFQQFENPELLNLSNTQNYIPIYNRFFNINLTNYNHINFNNEWYISSVASPVEENDNLFCCRIKNINTNKTKDKEVFFKLAPLLDPYKYMIGKYDLTNEKLFKLPKLGSTAEDCNNKLIDYNNSAYVDSLFLFFSGQLKSAHYFIHSLEYYGSFLSIKNNFKLNVFDDIDYLNNSDFFNKHKNVLFQIDDYGYLFEQEQVKLKPITIGNNVSLKSINSVNDEIFEGIFEDTENKPNAKYLENTIDLNGLKEMCMDLVDITDTTLPTEHSVTLKSSSTCSSRTSHTNSDDLEDSSSDILSQYDENERDDNNEDVTDDNRESEDNDGDGDEDGDNYADNDGEEDDDEDEDEDVNEDEEVIEVTIPKFPVQVIAMESCENTFDDLILNQELTTDEWLSAFMQIIMILITYQKAFHFTHNDLHTKNVMYNKTNKEYLYYRYKTKTYRVPTFGRIFKIIDFGRSIFKFGGRLFCSDSFQTGGDAATQYNTEPYFNDKKPRLDPNPSFDLCRLACSIFDNIINDFEEMKDLSNVQDPIKRIVFEWCLDDKGINMLYKNNGTERYPEFKLYKMIARCVHNHTPHSQLERPEFKTFLYTKPLLLRNKHDLMNIDEIPCYV